MCEKVKIFHILFTWVVVAATARVRPSFLQVFHAQSCFSFLKICSGANVIVSFVSGWSYTIGIHPEAIFLPSPAEYGDINQETSS